MTTKKYRTKIEITIEATFHSDPPVIKYGVDQANNTVALIDRLTVLTIDADLLVGTHNLIVDFINKKDSDCIPSQNLDKTIKIKKVSFDSFNIPQFIYISTYTPVYPEPWYSEQTPPPPAVVVGADLLGWNGCWQLNFESPVFPWIHRLGNMGWVWEI